MLRRIARQSALPTPTVPEASPIPRLRFDADTHPSAHDRATAWRTALSVSMDIRFEPGDLDGLAGALDLFPFGAATLAVIQVTSCTAVRTKAMINRWAYDHVAVDLFTQGGFTGTVGGRTVSATVGDCALFDLRGTMRIRLDAHRCVSLIVPRALFDQLAGGYLAVDGLVFRADSPEARLLAPVLEQAAAEAPGLTPTLATALGHGLTGLMAACVRGSVPVTRGPHAKPSAPTLAKVRRHIDRHVAEAGFGPDELCERFGLSRSGLYRLCEPAGGVAELIRHSRAELALHTLRQEDAAGPLEPIAQACGFPDVRAMRRVLLSLYGLTPRQARKATTTPELRDRHVGAEIAAVLDNSDA